jgi:DNA-binding beta-propeller fold protein YncE
MVENLRKSSRSIKILPLLLILCSSPARAQAPELVWPHPPDRARIRFVQTIASLENLESKKGFFAKLLGFFAGQEQTPRWLVQPVGIAVAPNGRIYVADPEANGVHVIDQKERKYEFLAGTKSGPFLSPVGVVVTDGGGLYISDSQRGEVVALDSDYDFLFAIRERLQRPTGLSIKNGILFVADAGRHTVVRFDLNGKYIGEFGRRGDAKGEFNFPVSITVGAADTSGLYVVDALNHRVQEFDTAGRYLSSFGRHGNVSGCFASPKSIARDSDGDLYVTDALMDNIQIFNPEGKLGLIVGRSGSGDGEFSSPSGIAIDRDDRIYVVETLNRRIQVFQYLK